MKCNACYTENINEATFCKSCGRNIRNTYLPNTSKSSILSLPILLCFIIFVAACILGFSKISALFEKNALSHQFIRMSAPPAVAYDKNKQTAYAYFESDGKHVRFDIYEDKAKYEVVQEGSGYKLLRAEQSMYFVSGNKAHEIKNCKDYIVSETGAMMAYLTYSGDLYFADSSQAALVDTSVLKYTVASDGAYIAYLRNDKAGMSGGVSADKNAFYIAKSEIAIESEDALCDEMLCANNLGFYYKTSDSSLLLVTKDDKEKTYPASHPLKDIVAVGTSSVLYSSTDGNTYVWNKTDEETVLIKAEVQKIITPDGCTFTGDNYKELLYTLDKNGDGETDAVAYVDAEGKVITEEAKHIQEMKTAGNSTKLYYTDSSDTLWRIDFSGKLNKRKCGEEVTGYVITDNAENAWYVSETGLYFFDGMLYNKMASITDVRKIILLRDGHILLETKSSVYMFDDEHLLQIVKDKKKIRAVSLNTVFSYYISGDELYIARQNGEFLTDEQAAAQADAAASSGTTE
ncbi:MAG: hypothetical protein IJO93_00970 [Clostridia bacterium]|nr:hypothetical protein [Clostridia bacterium]